MLHAEQNLSGKSHTPFPVSSQPNAPAIREPLATIVHDLGNLIQVATSAVNVLSRDPSVSGDDRASQAIRSARTSLECAGGLVRQSLRAARNGYTPVDTVSVETCLFDAKASLSIWEPEIHFEVQAEPNLPRLVCNAIGFKAVLLNLIVNARRAMPGGGTILLAARALVPDGAPAVEIVVADDGHGMTRETLERAFMPLFTTRSSGVGGYGLSAAKSFVQAAGGHINVESEPTVGTRVTIILPGYGIS
ncbi:Histidine kinase [Agrobacterium tumefaciens str. CFBP 5621]|nr:Histidine kinase [Agrobacterium tumefaciens str. CFBP 5621]